MAYQRWVDRVWSEGGRSVQGNTHARTTIAVDVGLDPDDVFASSITPFGEDFATAFESFTCTATDPHEDKGGVCGEGGNRELSELVPTKRGRERGVEEDHVEFERVQRRQVLQREITRWRCVRVDGLFFEIEQSLLLWISRRTTVDAAFEREREMGVCGTYSSKRRSSSAPTTQF